MIERNVGYAGLLTRGIAYLLDCTIAFAFFAATQLLLFVPIREAFNIGEEWFYSGMNTEIYMLITISLPIWLYFILLEQSSWQATVGKRVMKLHVVQYPQGIRIDGLQSLIRTAIKLLPWEIAHLVNNFPQPIMYTAEPGFRVGFVIVGLLMGVYMALVALTRRKVGVHDLMAKTVVVKKQKRS